MDNRKQQPFYVGQRVVCLVNYFKVSDPEHPSSVKNGKIYKVASCFWGGCYGTGEWAWGISVEGDNSTYEAVAFAPYDPPAIEIPAELLEVDVKDGIDVKPVKELI